MHAVVLSLALAASTWWPADALLPAQPAAQNLPAEADRLFETLALREGMTVGEIGAGAGELTVLIARRLGPAGNVHSTDINADRLREIRKAVEAAELQNVSIIEGGTVTTNLPDSCCDAIFMRSVYHHFEDPVAMNASVLRALKPGGRLAVMDFKPDHHRTASPGKRAAGDDHGVMPETVVAEATQAGFESLQTLEDWPGRLFLVLLRKPGATP